MKDYIHKGKIQNLTGYFEENISLEGAILDQIKTLNGPSIHPRVIEKTDAGPELECPTIKVITGLLRKCGLKSVTIICISTWLQVTVKIL